MLFLGRHGVTLDERLEPQPFEVDVELHKDLSGPSASDELADTIDYAGLFSPLFDLSQVHGFSAKVYTQHFYFDFIAGLGGYWASTFCQHWYHRIPLFVAIDALTTLALVTIVG